jgi:hypothetical protein
MHVRWQKHPTGRLQASLSEGRRVDGTIRHTHIGMLATLRPANPRRPTPAARVALIRLWPNAPPDIPSLTIIAGRSVMHNRRLERVTA